MEKSRTIYDPTLDYIFHMSIFLGKKQEMCHNGFDLIAFKVNSIAVTIKMNIKTNVRDIKLAGSHTLSQHIDYRLVVPVINENIDNDEAFGAVERIENASPNLHFKILGTTTDYRVSYDLARAVQKAIDILDLKKTFKKREEKMDSVALDEEEFDWDY